MPVRSLSSSVLRWPDAHTVDAAVRRWASHIARQHPEVVRVGYFGSYARGDWGVGSDLDIIIMVDQAARPFPERPQAWDTTELPVPADLFVYTVAEWQRLQGRFRQTISREVVWAYNKCQGYENQEKESRSHSQYS